MKEMETRFGVHCKSAFYPWSKVCNHSLQFTLTSSLSATIRLIYYYNFILPDSCPLPKNTTKPQPSLHWRGPAIGLWKSAVHGDCRHNSWAKTKTWYEVSTQEIIQRTINLMRNINLWEARWPCGWCAWLQSERSGFKPWPWLGTCVLAHDTSLSQCLPPPRCINGYRGI